MKPKREQRKSTRKIIALIDQTPELKEMIDQVKAISDQAEQEIDFLHKKAEQITQRCLEQSAPVWDRMETWLKERKLLPDGYTSDDLGYCLPENTIFFRFKQPESLQAGFVKVGSLDELPPEIRQAMLEELNKE